MSGPPARLGRATFRPLAEDDLLPLAGWLGEPHVSRWWHDSSDLEVVRGKYLPRIRGSEPIHCFTVNWDGVPCGMFQHSLWADYPGGLTDTVGAQAGEAGIDYLIGVPELIGRGLGRQMVGAFVEEIVLADPSVRALRVDINAENTPSRRLVEKLGFAIVPGREFLDDGESHVVYRRDA